MKFMLRTLACVNTVCCIGLMVAVPSYAALDPADIIAIWLFDEGEGDTAHDASRNPHGMDGRLKVGKSVVGNTVREGAENPKWVDGRFGNALKCEGEGSVISVPNFIKDERLGPNQDDADAGNLPGETEITITAWVKRNDKIGSAAQKDLFSFEPGGPWDNRILVHFPWDDGAGELIMWQYGGEGFFQDGPNWRIPDNVGELNHYAFTGDGNKTAIYQNGEVVQEGGGAKPFVRSVLHGPWHICGRFGSSAQVTVDDVGVFSRVLNHDEITTIMREGLAVAAGLNVEPAEKISTTWGVIKAGK